jgi:signal transduction histidine kinase
MGEVIGSVLFSLRSRLILLVLIAVLPGFLLTLFLANRQRQAALQAVETQNLSTLRLAAMSQSQLINSTQTLLATLAAAPIVRSADRAGCNALFANALKSSTGYRGFSVSDRTGKSWCRAPSPDVVSDNSQSEFFTRTIATKAFAMGGFQLGSVSRRGNLTFGFPVLDEHGEVQHVVAAGLDTDWLNRSIDALGLPAGYVVDILDRDGTFVARYPAPEDYVGKTYVDAAITQQILNQASDGQEHSAEMNGVEGIRRLYTFRRVPGVPDNDLFINVGIAPELAYAEINRTQWQNLLALGIFTLLAMIMSWVLASRALLMPISAIAHTAKEISKGNLGARTQLKYGRGELGLLARDIDEMCNDLQKRTDELTRLNADLELEVQLRTDQLQSANRKLHDSREQLRHLSHQQRELLEEEQTRISREVHDQIGQALTGLKMDLSVLQRRLVSSNPTPMLTDKIKAMADLIDDTIQTTRAIARRLRPSVLDDLGLGAAVEWQVSDFQQRTGTACSVINHNVNNSLNRDVATAAYRIVQEALTNVARHADASEVLIELEGRDRVLHVQVRDNGKGVPAAQLENPNSLGWLGMRERAHELGGSVEIRSTTGKGTLVLAMLPLVQKKS